MENTRVSNYTQDQYPKNYTCPSLMNTKQHHQPLGEILQQSGLISQYQLEVALYDLSNYENMRLGEVIASRGWIKQNTADFFADHWLDCLVQKPKYPLGFYLQKAGLLTFKQTEDILQEQPQTLIRFGSIAVLRGWLKQKTLDFFLISLFPAKAVQSSVMERYVDPVTLTDYPLPKKKSPKINEEFDSKQTLIGEIDYEDIPWID